MGRNRNNKNFKKTFEEHDVVDGPVVEPIEVKYLVGKVHCKRLNVRNEPKIGDNVVDVLEEGCKLTLIDENEEYYTIASELNQNNYVMKKFITIC